MDGRRGLRLVDGFGHPSGLNSSTAGNTTSDNRQFNCTTVRYALNQTTGWTNVGGLGDCQLGVCQDLGNNIPLSSTHNGNGGVNACAADGTVHWLSNTTPLSLLGQLAVRDDGTGGGGFSDN